MPPAPLSSSQLAFGGLGASILAPWGAILAPREQLGGPWEQQDGLEGVWRRISKYLGMILGPYVASCLSIEADNFNLFARLFPGHFLYRLLARILDDRCCQIQVCACNVLHNTTFHRNCCLCMSGAFDCLLEAVGTVFLNFVAAATGPVAAATKFRNTEPV